MLQAAKEPQQTSPPRHVGDFKDVVVHGDDGSEVRLGELWTDQPAVLVFLRHYG